MLALPAAVLLAASVVLVYLLIYTGGVSAQDEESPGHCDGTEIWCETLTVGSYRDVLDTHFGWDSGGSFTGAALSDSDFEFDGNTYELETIQVGGRGYFSLGFKSGGTGDIATWATRHNLVLHVGSTTFNLSTGTYNANHRRINWSRSGLSWSSSDTVDLKIVENHPATGSPTISGTAQVGQTLTADTSGIADEDGLGTFQYKWKRVDGTTETNIGTDASTYTLVTDDADKTIKVRVRFTDDGGSRESRSSEAVGPVQLGGL